MALVINCRGFGWGNSMAEDGEAVTWEAFWAEGSPWLHNGVARGRFTLRAP